MKISNFRNFVIENEVAYAEVDVTEGYWIWKKTRTEIVFNNHIINGKVYGFWKWISTADTPQTALLSECMISMKPNRYFILSS